MCTRASDVLAVAPSPPPEIPATYVLPPAPVAASAPDSLDAAVAEPITCACVDAEDKAEAEAEDKAENEDKAQAEAEADEDETEVELETEDETEDETDIQPDYNAAIYEDTYELFSHPEEDITFRVSVHNGIKNVTILSPNPVTLPLADFCKFVNTLEDPVPDVKGSELETRRYRDMYLVENLSRALIFTSFTMMVAVGMHLIGRT